MKKIILILALLLAAPIQASDYRFIPYDYVGLRYLPEELIATNSRLLIKYCGLYSVGCDYKGFKLRHYNPKTKFHPTAQAVFEVHMIKSIKYGAMNTSVGGVAVRVFDTKEELNEALWGLGLDAINWRLK